MKNTLRFMLAIALVLGAGPQTWADFSIDQPPTEVPADPGDILILGGAPVVDDGDGVPGAPLTLAVPGLLPVTPYDTDGISFAVPNDPFAPAAGAPPGVLVSIDDGDIGPGLGPPDNAVELFYSPLPPVGVSFPTKGTEALLGLLGNPPPIALDDDVDAYEDRMIPGPPGVFFSADWDAPAGLDPGDIYFSPLIGGPPVLACDDVTQMLISPNEATPVDVDAVHLVPNAVCAGFFPPGGPLCFLFSVDNVPPPPGIPPVIDPGDIYITDCMNGSALFLDDVTQMGLVPPPDEFAIFDIDAISVPDVGPGVCEFDGDGSFDVACGGTDCDDMDPNTYPGAPEICDGKDNNCDTVVPSTETDDDTPSGDGYVECSPWVGSVPGVLGGNDCDDTDPNVNPGVVEGTANGNCADTIDNDCDALIDSADPGCSGGSCAGTAAASVQAAPDAPEGSLLNLLAFLLIPVAGALGIVAVRRRR